MNNNHIISYDEYLIIEKLDFNQILKNGVKNFKNIIYQLIKKFLKLKNFSLKKNMLSIITVLVLVNWGIKNFKRSEINNIVEKKVTESSIIDIDDILKVEEDNYKLVTNDIWMEILRERYPNFIFKNYKDLSINEEGKKFIKNEEKLKLNAYDIGDDKITIGYGHTNSNYKLGDSITIEVAEKLFEKDIKNFEKGVKRMMKSINEDGKFIPLTQDMYNSLVSIAFNIGVSGLMNSDIKKFLEEGDYERASEAILNTKISSKFSGLEKRRIREKKLFMGDVEEI